MKYPDNLAEVTGLLPDYLGFIFYEKSPRYMAETLLPAVVQALPESIQRVGVFVDSTTEYMLEKAAQYGLSVLQLHGRESPEQCQALQTTGYTVIKVFSLGSEQFDFASLRIYQPYVDFFLFDTRGKQPGGNGQTFDWQLLKQYALDTPFFLSGGIGLTEITAIQQLALPQLYSVDVNSRFEIAPGRKDVSALATFQEQLSVPTVK